MTDDFATRIEAQRRYLLRVALLQLRNKDLAEDVVQETMVAALEGRSGFSGRSSVKTWLTGILKHKIVDAIRRKSREPARSSLEEESRIDEFDALFDQTGHWESPPEELMTVVRGKCDAEEPDPHVGFRTVWRPSA